LEEGLHRDLDLPTFLRQRGGDPLRTAGIDRDRLLRLHALARHWDEAGYVGRFIDLTFAFALARLGDGKTATRLMGKAVRLPRSAEIRGGRHWNPDQHKWIVWVEAAYQYRISQLLDGKSAVGPFPGDRIALLEALAREDRSWIEQYRQFSQVLEPHERVEDPFRFWREFRDDTLGRVLAELPGLSPPSEIADRVKRLFHRYESAVTRFRILSAALAVAPRVGESFAVGLLERVGPVQDKMPSFLDLTDLIRWVRLLENALLVAGHYDRTAAVPELLERITKLLRPLEGERAAWLVKSLTGRGLRVLIRIGLRDEVKQVHSRMVGRVLGGKPLNDLWRQPALNRDVFLPALLNLAGGWFDFGDADKAESVLEQARRELFHGRLGTAPFADVAFAYAECLGHAPIDKALSRVEDLFTNLPTTATTLSAGLSGVRMVRVVESAVLSLVNEEGALGEAVRRTLEEEEFLVRRRIHRDVRRAMAGAFT
jgi:hypothetical protein